MSSSKIPLLIVSEPIHPYIGLGESSLKAFRASDDGAYEQFWPSNIKQVRPVFEGGLIAICLVGKSLTSRTSDIFNLRHTRVHQVYSTLNLGKTVVIRGPL